MSALPDTPSHDMANTAPQAGPDRALWYALILLMVSINAMTREAVVTVSDLFNNVNVAHPLFSWVWGGMGGSYLVWMAVGVGLYLTWETRGKGVIADRADLLIGIFTMMLIMVPSGMINWAILAGFATYITLRSGERPHWLRRQLGSLGITSRPHRLLRLAGLLFLAIALRELVVIIAFKVPEISNTILWADTRLAELFLMMLSFPVEATGNYISSEASGGRILMLQGCSFLPNFTIAILALFTLRLWVWEEMRHRLGLAILLLLIGILILNTVRVAAMLIWPGSYTLLHGGQGSALFEALVLGFTFVIAFVTAPPE